jgi:phytoene/squalene synthetase
LRSDTEILDRHYFHNTVGKKFDDTIKKEIVDDIRDDFRSAIKGIRKLPHDSGIGVLIAYYYFLALLKKIENTPAEKHFERRIRIPDFIKFLILSKALVISKLRMI